MAKAAGNSYSPHLQLPHQGSTLRLESKPSHRNHVVNCRHASRIPGISSPKQFVFLLEKMIELRSINVIKDEFELFSSIGFNILARFIEELVYPMVSCRASNLESEDYGNIGE